MPPPIAAPADLTVLFPHAVWRYFSLLCSIPRASKQEGVLVSRIQAWALERGLEALLDAAGNLIVRKAATLGYEAAPGVALQGHLDMVCQSLSGHCHDFERDPIRAEVDDGWVVARETTLGADNGIGVALALAALENATLTHGPLEAVFTVDEEAGMSGARALAPGVLQSRYLINLDTEEWGKLYLGCAGGVEVIATFPAAAASVPDDWLGARLMLDGLQGGHSGIDIHRRRGHAIRLLIETVLALRTYSGVPFQLAALNGGSASNALPRFAEARLAVSAPQYAVLEAAVRACEAKLQAAWRSEEPRLTLKLVAEQRPKAVVPVQVWPDRLAAFAAMPYGVAAMSKDFSGVVETSNNLAPFSLGPEGGKAHFFVRSLMVAARDALAERIAAAIVGAGGSVSRSAECPPWAPRMDSSLLRQCQAAFRAEFGRDAKLAVIHAGLECGFFAASQPQLEMISFGPDIVGAHAPGERVSIASVANCWRLLKRLLAELART